MSKPLKDMASGSKKKKFMQEINKCLGPVKWKPIKVFTC